MRLLSRRSNLVSKRKWNQKFNANKLGVRLTNPKEEISWRKNPSVTQSNIWRQNKRPLSYTPFVQLVYCPTKPSFSPSPINKLLLYSSFVPTSFCFTHPLFYHSFVLSAYCSKFLLFCPSIVLSPFCSVHLLLYLPIVPLAYCHTPQLSYRFR